MRGEAILDFAIALHFYLPHPVIDHFSVILKTYPRDDEPSAEHLKFNRADSMSFFVLYVCRYRLNYL